MFFLIPVPSHFHVAIPTPIPRIIDFQFPFPSYSQTKFPLSEKIPAVNSFKFKIAMSIIVDVKYALRRTNFNSLNT